MWKMWRAIFEEWSIINSIRVDVSLEVSYVDFKFSKLSFSAVLKNNSAVNINIQTKSTCCKCKISQDPVFLTHIPEGKDVYDLLNQLVPFPGK